MAAARDPANDHQSRPSSAADSVAGRHRAPEREALRSSSDGAYP